MKNVPEEFGNLVFDDRVLKANLPVGVYNSINYCKTVLIEANTMIDIVRKQIIPAVEGYVSELVGTDSAKNSYDCALSCRYEMKLIKKLLVLTDSMDSGAEALEESL